MNKSEMEDIVLEVIKDDKIMDRCMNYINKRIKRDEKSGCDIWLGKLDKGFPSMSIAPIKVFPTRFLYAVEHEVFPSKQHSTRVCQNNKCVRLHKDHVVLLSGKEFVKAAIKRYGKVGSKYSGLTAEDVKQIRVLPLTVKEKAAQFRISANSCRRIISGREWSREYHPESWPEKDEDIMTVARLIEIRTNEIKDRGILKDAGYTIDTIISYISGRVVRNYVEFELDGNIVQIAETEQRRHLKHLNTDIKKIMKERDNGKAETKAKAS